MGEEARVEEHAEDGFFARYMHILVPMAIMATTLLIVAFGPLIVG